MNSKKLKKMFPHILFEADRKKALERRNVIENQAIAMRFFEWFELEELPLIGRVETAEWNSES